MVRIRDSQLCDLGISWADAMTDYSQSTIKRKTKCCFGSQITLRELFAACAIETELLTSKPSATNSLVTRQGNAMCQQAQSKRRKHAPFSATYARGGPRTDRALRSIEVTQIGWTIVNSVETSASRNSIASLGNVIASRDAKNDWQTLHSSES